MQKTKQSTVKWLCFIITFSKNIYHSLHRHRSFAMKVLSMEPKECCTPKNACNNIPTRIKSVTWLNFKKPKFKFMQQWKIF